jgi:virginiamycin B lyase
MQSKPRVLTLISLIFFLGSVCHGAAITGTVKGPDSAPFQGAFIEAQNVTTRITVMVLSDKAGWYRFEDLPGGGYNLRIRAIGYRSDPREGVTLTANQKTSVDWVLQNGTVRWSDLSFYQGDNLLPDGKGKQLLEQHCLECHSFQTKMAVVQRDESGWTQAVRFMREAMHYRLPSVTDDDAGVIASYLNSVFGPDSNLPRDVSGMPAYKKLVHPPFAAEAMKIVYVTYELPGPNRMPFSAAPDKNGNVWLPYFSLADAIGRLNPKTGEVQEFRVPFNGTAGIHSAVAASDGTVWLAEQGSNRVGKWDPQTREIVEYQDPYLPGKEGLQAGGSKHTIRIDPQGNVWSTGVPLTEFNPKTGKFTHFPDVPFSYGIALSRDGTPWFAEFNPNGKIGKVDSKTGKVTKYTVPTPNAWPRRIQVDADGIVWFTEFEGGGKITRFDPKTETFKEFSLPGSSPSPYAFDLDNDGRLWYSNMHEDVVGCLDPKTGHVTEYPFPFSENTMREFFHDSQGRIWWGSPSNNKVGYFYLTGNGGGAESASR